MAIYSLAQLKNFAHIRACYHSHERQNKAYADLAKKEKQAVLDRANAATKEIDQKVDAIYYKKGAYVFHIISVILALVLFVGCFSFLQPVLSFDFDDVLTAYDQKAKEKPSIVADGIMHYFEGAYSDGEGGYLDEPIEGEDLEKYEEWRTTECELLVGGCMLLAALVILLLSFVVTVCISGRAKPWSALLFIMGGLIVFYVLCYIVFVCRGAWNDVTGLFSFIGAILNIILMLVVSPFGALVFVFRAGYVMFLAALLAPAMLTLGYVAYSTGYAIFLANNDGNSSTSAEATALVRKKKSIIANCPKEAEAVYKSIMAKITPNPYKKSLDQVPYDVEQDLSDLIWAWENGYAWDYVSARQFVQQQKNHKALLQQREAQQKEMSRQLAKIQQSVDQQTQAIRDAANKAVDVYIHY